MRNALAQIDLNKIQQQGLQTGDNDFKFPIGSTIGSVVSAALPYIFFVAGGLVLFFFISAGYTLMFAAGDPKAIAGGKAKLTYAIIGLVIVFTAFWIVQIFGRFLGLQDIITTFGTGTPCIPTPTRPCLTP